MTCLNALREGDCAASISAATAMQAQPPNIERGTLGDNDLSCAQLHGETVAMDWAFEEARKQESRGNTTQTAGVAVNVATEVLSRTGGFFGALGGIAGLLVGTVAGRTASTAAQQSGQTSWHQAQDRMRQASARKEHVAGLFLRKGCRSDDLAHTPPRPTNAQTVDAAPAGGAAPVHMATASSMQRIAAQVASTLPGVDPDVFFKGKTGGTFGKNIAEALLGHQRVALAGLRMIFVTKDESNALVRATYLGGGRETSGARSRTRVVLRGLPALADKAYEDFLAQLKLAGCEVVSIDEMREMLAGMDVTPSTRSAPFAKEQGSQIGAAFSPTALPLWFDQLDGSWSPKVPFDQTNWRRVNDYATKMNAIIVAPLIVVHFARAESSGNRSAFTARSAETDAHIGMHIPWAHTRVIRAKEPRMGLVMKGDDGTARLEQHISTQREFGEIRVASAADNNLTVNSMDIFARSMGGANQRRTLHGGGGGRHRPGHRHARQVAPKARGALAP